LEKHFLKLFLLLCRWDRDTPLLAAGFFILSTCQTCFTPLAKNPALFDAGE
jgi:hypothetical protein